jgi:hypothetical protein
MKFVEYQRGGEWTEEEEWRLFSTSTVIPVGRNEELADLEDHIHTPWRGSCGSVLNDIIVGADTNLLPCCGIITKGLPELTLSNLRETSLLDAIDSANKDVILNWIALEGPSEIIEFVKSRDPSIQFRDEYVGICDACNDVFARPEVRKVLAEHIDEIVDRVALHRSFLELTRSEEDIARTYTR